MDQVHQPCLATSHRRCYRFLHRHYRRKTPSILVTICHLRTMIEQVGTHQSTCSGHFTQKTAEKFRLRPKEMFANILRISNSSWTGIPYLVLSPFFSVNPRHFSASSTSTTGCACCIKISHFFSVISRLPRVLETSSPLTHTTSIDLTIHRI